MPFVLKQSVLELSYNSSHLPFSANDPTDPFHYQRKVHGSQISTMGDPLYTVKWANHMRLIRLLSFCQTKKKKAESALALGRSLLYAFLQPAKAKLGNEKHKVGASKKHVTLFGEQRTINCIHYLCPQGK